jgi:nicotinamide-nucleotide amidase
MHVELLMIGTELLIGQILDTNAQYMAQTLALNGINIYWKTTVGDNQERIMASLDTALRRADVVLCSGGLGPTEDDITRESIGALLGRPLAFHPDLWETISARFTSTRSLITENNKRQAMLPQGGQPIPNPNGTAPGVIVDDPRGIIICMPGVPMELKAMLEDSVIPFLQRRFDLQGILRYRVLRVCGTGESRVDALIGDLITTHSNPTIGLLASPEAVRIRIAARSEDSAAAEAMIEPVEQEVRARLVGMVLAPEDETVEGAVARLLQLLGWTVVVYEAGTGGAVAQKLSLAEPSVLAEARVTPRGQTGGRSLLEFSFDTSRKCLVQSSANCALVLVEDRTADLTQVVFETPRGRVHWEVGHYGSGWRRQIRTSVVALEQVRRQLTEWLETR